MILEKLRLQTACSMLPPIISRSEFLQMQWSVLLLR
jgi:hypothetical protein